MTKSIRIKGEAKGYNLVDMVDKAIGFPNPNQRADDLAAYIGRLVAKQRIKAITSTELCELTLDALVHESNGAIEVNW